MAGQGAIPTLYFHPMSFYSQKALFALAEKGVKYEPRVVNIMVGETYAPWYMKLNPRGQIPALQHGEKIIVDSKLITEYIDQTFEGPKLFPQDYKDTKEFISLVDSISIKTLTFGSVLHPDLTVDNMMPAPMKTRFAETVKKESPSLQYLEKYKSECLDDPELQAAYQQKIDSFQHLKEEFSRENFEKQIDYADTVFEKIEKQLQVVTKGGTQTCWLLGPAFTAADIALTVAVKRLTMVGLERLWSGRPLLEKYRERLLEERPHYLKSTI